MKKKLSKLSQKFQIVAHHFCLGPKSHAVWVRQVLHHVYFHLSQGLS